MMTTKNADIAPRFMIQSEQNVQENVSPQLSLMEGPASDQEGELAILGK